MKSTVGVLVIFLITELVFSAGNLHAQQTGTDQKDVQVLDNNNQEISPSIVNYIGEIKGHSYIKLTLYPLEQKVNDEGGEKDNHLHFKGSYYEAVNGKSYPVNVDFDSENRTWYIKCYNRRNQFIAAFQGRETSEDTIEGIWKSKNKSLTFYLFRKESK